MTLISPIHTATINGHPLRFFKGPAAGPDLPWHAMDDLYRAMALSLALRRHMLQMTQRRWGGDLRTVATADGPVVIAPHFVAQGMIGAAVETMGVPASFEGEYTRAGVEAMKKLTGDLPPQTKVAFAVAAFHGQGSAGGDKHA